VSCKYPTCKRFHPKRGQTIDEYIEANGFVFPKKIQAEEKAVEAEKSTWTVVDRTNDQYIIRIEESDDEEEEIFNIDELVETCKKEFMTDVITDLNLGVHDFIERLVHFMLNFARSHNLSGDVETQFKNRIRESGMYAEYQAKIDDMGMEEVCDELDILVHQQEFADEVDRIYEDPHVTEFDEFQEQVEFVGFFREMQHYALMMYGIQSF